MTFQEIEWQYDGITCPDPDCDGTVGAGSPDIIGSDTILRPAHCQECGLRFMETYQLVPSVLVELPLDSG